MEKRIQFNRNELSGSFGDIGTDFPLIVGMILATNLDVASVFIMFGLMQILTGIAYGLPMPMQPLKAMAVLVIAQNIDSSVLFGGGLAIGFVMLVLSLSGSLDWVAKKIPPCVVRGIQFGLGLSLASLALKTYVPSMGTDGYILALVGFVIMVVLMGNRRFPPGIFVIGLGFLYAIFFKVDFSSLSSGIGLSLPKFSVPQAQDILTGFVILSLPQLPLSLSNSVIATHKTVQDLFPQKKISVKKIGLTYALINLVMPFFNGIPVCHGCGGLAGHYAFGGRTGGSVVIYGSVLVVIGLMFSQAFHQVIEFFPKPILGVVLLFEALTLLLFIRDQAKSKRDTAIALLVGLMALTLPQGYVLGLIVGTILYYGHKRFYQEANI
ncbi:MAG TPA: putative sulfate/molybdate transporter [Candidatus Omnitrophota bacterium]|nr:putative sulfate/molybdate transporter [Candidatus Omnitrophota bacterium]